MQTELKSAPTMPHCRRQSRMDVFEDVLRLAFWSMQALCDRSAVVADGEESFDQPVSRRFRVPGRGRRRPQRTVVPWPHRVSSLQVSLADLGAIWILRHGGHCRTQRRLQQPVTSFPVSVHFRFPPLLARTDAVRELSLSRATVQASSAL